MTPEIERCLRAVEEALAVHQPECESSDVVDIPKLHLADAVIAAIETQRARVGRLPKCAKAARVPVVVEVTLRPKRQRSA